MRTLFISAVAVATTASGARAGFDFTDLLPGYDAGALMGISADGSTLAILATDMTTIPVHAHAWRGGGASGWVVQPNPPHHNAHQSLSADGRRQLISRYTGGLDYFENGGLVEVENAGGYDYAGGLTRDGSSVIFARTHVAPLPPEIAVWAGGQTHELGVMNDRYAHAIGVLSGLTADRFVINTELAHTPPGRPDPHRAVIYDRGVFQEIGTLGDAPALRSTATGMTADGSLVVGYEFDADASDGFRSARSWMLDDTGLRELTFEGLTGVRVASVTDDGDLLTGRGYDADGRYQAFLAEASGRVWLMSDLLAGMDLPAGWSVADVLISADGRTLGGSLYHDLSDLRPSFFRYTLPTPGPIAALAAAGLLAARRRRPAPASAPA